MEIKKLTEEANGNLGILAEFDNEEAQFLIEFAINHLLAIGSVDYLDTAIQEQDEPVQESSNFYVPGNRTLH